MPLVLNDLLGKPGLQIYQDPELFNFSIDSILLANFATVLNNTKSIVDLCSGNGPIPLYLTTRTSLPIIGVEIQEKSYDLALKSIQINNLESQITMINDNLIDIHKRIGQNCFNLVTCNPPFFKNEAGNKNGNMELTIARHEVFATLDDIIKEASILLNTGGIFSMVHRPDRLVEILETLKKYRLEPKRLRFIYPKKDKQCNHILIEAKKDGKSGGLKILEPLIVYDEDNKWSNEIRKIYNSEV